MRVWDIIFFTFLVHIMFFMLNGLTIFASPTLNPNANSTAFFHPDQSVNQTAFRIANSNVTANTTYIFGDFIYGAAQFFGNIGAALGTFGIIAAGVVYPAGILRQFNWPETIIFGINSIMYVIYAIGIIQFIANRPLKSYE